jgi:DNA-binding transcriptional MerR regulator
MAHENAKLLLGQADTFSQRAEAVRQAIALGMPLSEIELYLDWLDQTQPLPSRPDEEQADRSASG